MNGYVTQITTASDDDRVRDNLRRFLAIFIILKGVFHVTHYFHVTLFHVTLFIIFSTRFLSFSVDFSTFIAISFIFRVFFPQLLPDHRFSTNSHLLLSHTFSRFWRFFIISIDWFANFSIFIQFIWFTEHFVMII